jgi:hypothetical protein
MRRNEPASGEGQRLGTEDLVDAGERQSAPAEATREETQEGAPEQTIPRQDRASTEAGERPAEREDAGALLFSEEEITRFRDQWNNLQSSFVDDPRLAVRQADELVAQMLQTLASTFAEHKHTLEQQWQQEREVATEDLRLALRRYRAFFRQLLSA